MRPVPSRARAQAKKTCPRCGTVYESDAAFCPTDGAPLSAEQTGDPYIGTVISGDIEILSVAGVGAMGRVYRAHQRGVERDVAVKILLRELSGNTPLVQRFHREAKIASRLQHPHVVEVYLAGQLPDGALFIVMEYLDGMSLGAALTQAGGGLLPARALSIALQICDAVGEGHARGIVHRDLKPENVMLVRRADVSDWVKVLDFGIAKAAAVEQSMQTAAGLVFGTARYISPEGAQGAVVGPPGDVYSLATIVYQMLAGRTPFDAEPVGLLIKHIHEVPPPLTSWPPAANVPPALAQVVMDNLAKQPDQRAPDARAFGAALAKAAREAGILIADAGVLARLAHAMPERPPVEATMDDAASVRPPPVGVLPHASPLAPSPPQLSARSDEAARPPKRNLLVIVLAFLLGAALTVLVTQQIERRIDAAHDLHVKKTRAALADSRYITPPGDCVRDLVVAGLARWPDDVELLQLRSTASMELVTRAMVAQNGGDVSGALDLARDATALDPTDHSAALLLSQYEDESRSAALEGGASLSRPHVAFDAIPLTQPGKRIELSARIMPGNLGSRAKVQNATMTLFDHSATVNGINIPVTPLGQGLHRAAVLAPKPGNYDIVFEASIEGIKVRAVRELTVTP